MTCDKSFKKNKMSQKDFYLLRQMLCVYAYFKKTCAYAYAH